ncbi:cAMP-binding protein - catabolite gene activator and regulatory subunit of cAMP-dependent protein kinase [Oleiphilus messinensis]|uniref:cAMP-binding protein-catabolite gene activator and regulatory subunit of cAMP-dependent protein kinase n=1 Tax=Oleiphilus messinensis TaxID=141451 RepID=A0A1Y0I4J9_9GAMM|nr:fumarate/nitrate reduction transcriptional regulator Fnr [Oleiphilus messinensis]ARU55170.1 cAMP-binding protein - catabolite gene activator and regulatory subunit of cAMP-dependent protein kinase [Oleiphilus messinensis]
MSDNNYSTNNQHQGNDKLFSTENSTQNSEPVSQNSDKRCSKGLLPSSCNTCSLSNLCLPIAVTQNDISQLEDIIKQGKIIDRGEHIFSEHTPFRSCFAVRSGSIKTYVVSEEGEEQVTGFYLPGEIIGMDSMNTDAYSCSAKALEKSSVCEIPFDRFETLATQIPTLQHHFFQLMSKEIKESRQLSMLLSKNTAEERIASLLLSLSERFKRRKLSPTQFRLPMPRNDIGNYLGLAVETVSRVFTRFQKSGLITVQGREVTINDLDKLKDMLKHQTKCLS